MSDSDADDSGFDREAERERLREKYGDDAEDRAETERMSELLLQGATMTNKHCDRCGNPIFRYDGQEFCPVCQQPDADQDSASAQQATTDQRDASSTTASATPSDQPAQDADAGEDRRQPQNLDEGRENRRQSQPQREAPVTPAPSSTADGDIETARASLVRTLTTLTQHAEAADDVRRAREYLEAAGEAADALAALDQLR